MEVSKWVCSFVCVLGCHALTSSISRKFVCEQFNLWVYSIKLFHGLSCCLLQQGSVSAAASLSSVASDGANSACSIIVLHKAGFEVSAYPLGHQCTWNLTWQLPGSET